MHFQPSLPNVLFQPKSSYFHNIAWLIGQQQLTFRLPCYERLSNALVHSSLSDDVTHPIIDASVD
jgi:hypothetical protein